MTTDRAQLSGGGSPRQKIIAGLVLLVFAFLAWQVYGMFASGSSPATPAATANAVPTMPTPQPAQLPQVAKAPLSDREQALMALQQETQAKYLAALNELQMLKVEKDIAETNKAIVTAKLDTVTAQKNMVDLLQPSKPAPTQAEYSQNLVNPTGANASATPGVASGATSAPVDNYTVISVSHLQGRWNAVMGYQGRLMNVFVGDTLPVDGSQVTNIDKSGVTLKLKDGNTKKISMVSII
jgi:type IV pilus biogenesis protein PilP